MSIEQESQAKWVRSVRGRLGLSQSQLANLMGLSPRAIQSYEQGWRDVPRTITAQLMTVLALHRGHADQGTPCWRLTGCPEEKRAGCSASTVGRGRFCWLLAGRSCGPIKAAGSASGLPCVHCVVFRNLLDDPRQHTVAGEGASPHATVQEKEP